MLSGEDAVIGLDGNPSQAQKHSSHICYLYCSMGACEVRLGCSGQSCVPGLSNCSAVSVF